MSTNISLLYFIAVLLGQASWCAARLAAPYVVDNLTKSPHKPCFTEGLSFNAGLLYESCADDFVSTVRIVAPSTGEVVRLAHLPRGHFSEGLTVHGGVVYVATWKEGWIHLFHADNLTYIGRKSFRAASKEGWGLTTDGRHLILSNGSCVLTYFALPDTSALSVEEELRPVRLLQVVDERGSPVEQLNELEYVYGSILANLWPTDTVVRIRADTGRVTHFYSLERLSALARDTHAVEGTTFKVSDIVPNGIAFDPTSGQFVLAGKLWPVHFFVHLGSYPLPAAASGLAVAVLLLLLIGVVVLVSGVFKPVLPC